jgi:uncharacterized protein YueI
MDDSALNRVLPRGRDLEALKDIRTEMIEFETVTKTLQESKLTVMEVRLIFDEIINIYPSMSHHLDADASIVRNTAFESGIFKVIANEFDSLNEEEFEVLEPFRRVEERDSVDVAQGLVQRALKKQKRAHVNQYYDLSYIPPTSNVCERLFSAAR